MTYLSSKKILLISFAILFLGVSLFFRGSISRLLTFGPEIGRPQPPEIKKEEGKIINPPAGSPITSSGVEEAPLEHAIDDGKSLPPYTGRNPAEIRPLDEEVKLFSEEQREKIYSDIRRLAASVKENPNFLFGWTQLGLLKKMIGDYEGARDAWEYASLIRPTNSLSFANLGELYWRYLHDYPAAEKNFRISIKNKPNDPSTYISLSDLYSYSYREKSNLADDILLEGITANPGDVNLYRALAYLYERQKEYDKSIEWWQKVLEKEPDNKEVAATIEALKKK